MDVFLLTDITYASRVRNMQTNVVLEKFHFAPAFLINSINVLKVVVI